MNAETDKVETTIVAYCNRPPIRFREDSIELLERWCAGPYGCRGGTTHAAPCSTGGWHVWARVWSEEESSVDYSRYGGVVTDAVGVADSLADLLGDNYERIAEAMEAFECIGLPCIDLG